MTTLLRDWQDGFCQNFVIEAWPLRHDQARLIEACRGFEEHYFELSAGLLVSARSQVLEAARYPWPLEPATLTPRESGEMVG
jgi:hypothetical protein